MTRAHRIADIHYRYHKLARPMTASIGPEVHSYKACYFDDVAVNDTGCQAFSGVRDCRSGVPILEWKVARAGYD